MNKVGKQILELLQRAEQNVSRWKIKLNFGFNYNPLINYANETGIQSMSIVCPHCNALEWTVNWPVYVALPEKYN